MDKTIVVDAELHSSVRTTIETRLTIELRSVVSLIEKLKIALHKRTGTTECVITATTNNGNQFGFSTINYDPEVCVGDAIARLRRETMRLYKRVGTN